MSVASGFGVLFGQETTALAGWQQPRTVPTMFTLLNILVIDNMLFAECVFGCGHVLGNVVSVRSSIRETRARVPSVPEAINLHVAKCCEDCTNIHYFASFSCLMLLLCKSCVPDVPSAVRTLDVRLAREEDLADISLQ